MFGSSSDDPVYRPVGADGAKRRLFTLRHLLMFLAVVVLGGGGGTAAYFLSDTDLRDVIGFLDIADPGSGPKLTMLMPGVSGQVGWTAPLTVVDFQICRAPLPP